MNKFKGFLITTSKQFRNQNIFFKTIRLKKLTFGKVSCNFFQIGSLHEKK